MMSNKANPQGAAAMATLYRRVAPDYEAGLAPPSLRESRAEWCKEIIAQRLPQAERVILVLYAELQSFRKLGQLLGISHTLARQEVGRIRQKVLDIYRNEYDK